MTMISSRDHRGWAVRGDRPDPQPGSSGDPDPDKIRSMGLGETGRPDPLQRNTMRSPAHRRMAREDVMHDLSVLRSLR